MRGDVATIIGADTFDVRFPTSSTLDGSDAMNADPDYSAAYLVLRTDVDRLAGHSFAFTIGRGNEVQRVAIDAIADVVLGRSVDSVIASPGELWSATVGDSQFRWLGPEKGVVHMAAGAVLNAVWDLRARVSGRPLWLLLAEMDPAEVVEAVPFDHIEDAITADDALAILRGNAATRAERIETLLRDGYPAYTTTPGWLGYSDEKMTGLAKQVVADGFRQIKLKVGADLDDDVRRTRLAREAIGDSVGLAVDANQVWEAHQAGAWINALESAHLAWIEEPTHPDDVLGHRRIRDEVLPIPIATGEHCANRVMFKQFLQADAIDIVQLDAARVGGVNENLAIMLLAAKFGRPVCPHAGGVGLCELVQHLAMFDYIGIAGSMEGRWIEYVDHLHEHFVDPVRIVDGRYRAPASPGMSAEMVAADRLAYSYPDGVNWARTN
jgi:L-fuconate dehydratase